MTIKAKTPLFPGAIGNCSSEPKIWSDKADRLILAGYYGLEILNLTAGNIMILHRRTAIAQDNI
jgi:hypothetical protein